MSTRTVLKAVSEMAPTHTANPRLTPPCRDLDNLSSEFSENPVEGCKEAKGQQQQSASNWVQIQRDMKLMESRYRVAEGQTPVCQPQPRKLPLSPHTKN